MPELNPQQREAVEHGEGPLLVLAGPGSGKTRVITERIVYLLAKARGLRPDNILALTYTNKAAEEMKRRVADALPGLETAPHISTFHSFCFQVLSERQVGRRLLDKVDLWIFLRRRMERLGLEFYRQLASPGAFLHDLMEFFSRCQDELIGPDEFEAYVGKLEREFNARAAKLDPAERNLLETEVKKLRELARVFDRAESLLGEAGCSSLGSLVAETVALWDGEPESLERWRSQFRFALVDEFQDTNYAQVELLARIAVAPYNITAVGDDDQAIYRFRGAAHGAFAMFRRTFPGAGTVFLSRNYRSTKRILRAAETIIRQNQREVRKPALSTDQGEGPKVSLLESPDDVSEAAGVAGLIQHLLAKGTPPGDIAALYRAHSHRDLLVAELRSRKIPFAIRGLSLLSTVILRDLIAYLRLVHSPHENISLTRALLARRWRFPESLALDARRAAANDRCSLFQAIEGFERTLFRQELENTGWPELKALLTELRGRAARLPITEVLDALTESLDLRFLPDDPDRATVTAFRTFLEGWEKKSETRRLDEFIEYFDYFLEAGGKIEAPESAEAREAVQMMTVHAAKGLEFPAVIVLSVAPQRFPQREQKPVIEFPAGLRKGPEPPEDIHRQEERRLFYVALTRAKEQLFVSSIQKRRPSSLVDDLLSDPAVVARDIEIVELPPVAEDEGEALRAPRAVTRRERAGQAGLFGAHATADAVHPPLEEWATQSAGVPADGKLQLSATAIETYLECPLKFKFSRYLKIPTGPQATLTFGNLMHQSVRHYFELRKTKLPAFEEIQEFYLRSWKSAGFEDSYQEKTYEQAGLEQLRAFVERQNSIAITAEKIQSEESFKLELGGVLLEGRIDQIIPLDAGRAKAVELVDYKTGRPRTQKDADKSLQLSVYALAARQQLHLDPERLTFYNLANNQPVSTTRTEEDFKKAETEIHEVAEEIRGKNFRPTPGFVCKYCDYVPICPAHENEP